MGSFWLRRRPLQCRAGDEGSGQMDASPTKQTKKDSKQENRSGGGREGRWTEAESCLQTVTPQGLGVFVGCVWAESGEGRSVESIFLIPLFPPEQ